MTDDSRTGTAVRPNPVGPGAGSAGSGQGAGPAGSTGGQAAAAARQKRRVRRARLRLTHIDPWSVMKTAFLLSIAFAIVTVVSVFIVWTVLDAAGVWDSINSTIADVVGSDADSFDIEGYVGMSRVMGLTLLIAAVDVVLITAMATLGAFLYNLAAALLGGIDVTLAEER
ncbi:DUF3566 domain-containing protein [Nocardioides zeae]|uniref:DUF3566 domain-containing protein n=1 Tax=Nocardioides zeae TaxID=1457234 RepID=A0A6P0HHE9_9ACTN|nr:DUF3566 domain-containing protein [Nocardioides zeae]NEN78078.1 DUF3566 domain-containing protein [Nocardioides zeae]